MGSYTVKPRNDSPYKIVSKSFRHQIFAKFICDNFQQKSLKNILDIAGGKCKLSIQILHRIPKVLNSTIIDPSSKIEYIALPEYLRNMNLVDMAGSGNDADGTINKFLTLQKSSLQVRSEVFDEKFDPGNNSNYTAIFGLHPDQATVRPLNFSLPVLFLNQPLSPLTHLISICKNIFLLDTLIMMK